MPSGCASEHRRGAAVVQESKPGGVASQSGRTSRAQGAERVRGAPGMAELGRGGPSVWKPSQPRCWILVCILHVFLWGTPVSTQRCRREAWGRRYSWTLMLRATGVWVASVGRQPRPGPRAFIPPPTRPYLVRLPNSDEMAENAGMWGNVRRACPPPGPLLMAAFPGALP